MHTRETRLSKYTIEYFDKERDKYSEEDRQSAKENYWIFSKLATHLDDRRHYKLLELGCGGGGFLRASSSTFDNINLYGIDVTKSLVVLARKRKKTTLLMSDVGKLPFKPNSFDIAICRNLMHHLIGKNLLFSRMLVWHALLEVKRTIKKRGYFILIEQGISAKILSHLIFIITYTFARLNLSLPKLGIRNKIIVAFLTPREVSDMLTKSRMEVLEKQDVRGPGFQKFLVRMFIVATIRKG